LADEHQALFKHPDNFHIRKVSGKAAKRLQESEFKVINDHLVIRKTGQEETLHIRSNKDSTGLYFRRKSKKTGAVSEGHALIHDDPLYVYKQIDRFEQQMRAIGIDPNNLHPSDPYVALMAQIGPNQSISYNSADDLRKYLSKFSSKSLRYVTLIKRTWEDEAGEGDE